MAQKYLVILTPYEEQGLLRLAARLEISPLYALRYCLLEILHKEGLIHDKIYQAILCKLLERPAPPPEELKVTNAIQGDDVVLFDEYEDLPYDLSHVLSRAEMKFSRAFDMLRIGKINERELEFWIREARRHSFLRAARHFLEYAEKLIGEAPSLSGGHVVSGCGAGRGRQEGGFDSLSRGPSTANNASAGGDNARVTIKVHRTLKGDMPLPSNIIKIAKLVQRGELTYERVTKGERVYARLRLPNPSLLSGIPNAVVELRSDYVWIPLDLLEKALKAIKEAEA